MNPTPLFDCVTHPTPTGGWLRPGDGHDNTLECLRAQMREADVRWAFAIGMDVGGYEEKSYASWVRGGGGQGGGEGEKETTLFPVAYYDFRRTHGLDQIPTYLATLKALGYVGVKIHPRRSEITWRDERLPTILAAARRTGLVVLLCTYAWEANARAAENSVGNLMRLLAEVPEERLILVHGGGVRLLEYVEIARAFPNVLLDLSLTLCKYEGSSLDLDLAFCFRQFDRRICVGSDAPEFGLSTLRRRFDQFAEGIADEKRVRIAHGNLLRFLGCDDRIPVA